MPHEYSLVSPALLDNSHTSASTPISCASCHAALGEVTSSDLKCPPCRNRLRAIKVIIQPTADEHLPPQTDPVEQAVSPCDDSNWPPLSPDDIEQDIDEFTTINDNKSPVEKLWNSSIVFPRTRATSIPSAVDKPYLNGSPTSPVAPNAVLPAATLLDITQLRVHSEGRSCITPGAMFQGHQTNGASKYDVVVNLLEVDFSSNYLCGQLRIRGLTSDCPDITTYFDAEILGTKHGFLTRKWGATDADDMRHWAKFPAFRRVKSDLQGPRRTLPNRDYGAIFMRWKERFIISETLGDNIPGASFDGFYYICVDFEAGSSGSRAPTLNGFYYHLETTADQELILTHDSEALSPVFEFR